LPKTPNNLQRQHYLQPFEQLFETIETTRTLKSTLDDQIRRSSSLIQTLQASASTIEGLVRNQVQKEWESLVHRVEVLESRQKKTPEQDLDTPPTILKSQNDINLLTTLKDRLDRLERQVET
jgi:hypothetical protein